jgi:two-component system, cell cycle sensor histidine kinase and response regulator CckA
VSLLTPPAPRLGTPSAAQPRPADRPGVSKRVLIVDDEEAVRGVLRRWFVRRGWIVVEAIDGLVARELIETSRARAEVDFDLVICDLRMPSLSGPDLYDWLCSSAPNVLGRMLFRTGDVSETEAAAFLERSASPVLEKPFELPALAELVERICMRASAA